MWLVPRLASMQSFSTLQRGTYDSWYTPGTSVFCPLGNTHNSGDTSGMEITEERNICWHVQLQYLAFWGFLACRLSVAHGACHPVFGKLHRYISFWRCKLLNGRCWGKILCIKMHCTPAKMLLLANVGEYSFANAGHLVVIVETTVLVPCTVCATHFEDGAPVDEIDGCLIFKWVASAWFNNWVPG